jgi:hypothetical protein
MLTGCRLESTRGQFRRYDPDPGGKKQKEEASWLSTVMIFGGRLAAFFSPPLRCLLEEKIVGLFLEGPLRQTLYGGGASLGGFVPWRVPGWSQGNCCQSADTCCATWRSTNHRMRCFLLAAVSDAGMGRAPRRSFPRPWTRSCLARSALFQAGRVGYPQP